MFSNTHSYSYKDDYILDIKEQEEIIEWTKKNYNRLEKNGFNRYNGLLENYQDIPQVVWDVKSRIIKIEKLEQAIQNQNIKIVLDICLMEHNYIYILMAIKMV